MPSVSPWLQKYVGPGQLDPNWTSPVPGALPNGIAVDGSGNVYVLEGSAQIVTYDPNGVIAASPVPLPAAVSGQQPHGLGVDAGGACYVVTWGDRKAYRISPDASGGTATATDLAFEDLPPGGGVRTPNGLCLDPNSSVLYVASAISDASNFVHSAPLPAPGSPAVWTQVNAQNNGAGVYYKNIAADGTYFYVTDMTGKRIYRMAKTANAAPELLQALGSNPGGVAVDGSGNVYAVARGSGTDDGKIYRLAPGGATPTPAPTSGPTATPAATAVPDPTTAPTRSPTTTPGTTSTPAPTVLPSVSLYPSPSVAVPTPAVGVTGAVPLTSPSPLPSDAPPLTPGPPGSTLRIAQDALTELFGFENPQLQLVHGDGYRWIFDLQGSSTFSVQVRTERTEEGGYVYLYTIFLRSGDQWIAFANGSASKGGRAASTPVLQRFDVADNGSFDFDARTGYVEIQAMEALLAAPKATATPAARGGSGGCSAGPAVPSLILLATPLAFLARRKR